MPKATKKKAAAPAKRKPGTFVIAKKGGTTNIVQPTNGPSEIYRIRSTKGSVGVFTTAKTRDASIEQGGSYDARSGPYQIVLQADVDGCKGTYEIL